MLVNPPSDRSVYCRSTVDSRGSGQLLAHDLSLMDLVVHARGSRLGGHDRIGHANRCHVSSSYRGVRSPPPPSTLSPGLYWSNRTHPKFFMCRSILSFSSTFVPRSAIFLSDCTCPLFCWFAQHLSQMLVNPPLTVACTASQPLTTLDSGKSLAYDLFLMDLVVHECGNRLVDRTGLVVETGVNVDLVSSCHVSSSCRGVRSPHPPSTVRPGLHWSNRVLGLVARRVTCGSCVAPLPC